MIQSSRPQIQLAARVALDTHDTEPHGSAAWAQPYSGEGDRSAPQPVEAARGRDSSPPWDQST